MHRRITALVSLALASRVALANWPLHAWGGGSQAGFKPRVWYGDGIAYTGPTVPDDVEKALNVTVNSDRTELVVIEPDTETNPASAGALEDPIFMSLAIGRNTDEPVRFLHSAVGLTPEDVYFFVSVEGYWYPATRDGLISDLSSGVYAVPAGAGETRVLRWFDDADRAEELGGIRVTLTTKGADP